MKLRGRLPTLLVSLLLCATAVHAGRAAHGAGTAGTPDSTLAEPDQRTPGSRAAGASEPAVSAGPRSAGILGGPPTGIFVPEMAACDGLVDTFMTTYGIPGATFALAKDGKLVYLRGFGTADVAGLEPTQPYHLFRIASISKPITAIAIMQMVERGQLNLDALVFGPGGLLASHPEISLATITDPRVYDIRVRHLLEHSAGWDRSVNCFPDPTLPYPRFFGGCDPIAVPWHVATEVGAANPATAHSFIRYLLEKGLNFAPGTRYAYSNIGYSVLGEIIEEISVTPYEQQVRNQVFEPLGICDIQPGRNLLAEKREREGEYVGNGYITKSCYGTGDDVLWEYGGFNLEGMLSHGGWIASARALTQLLVGVDGFATRPDLLGPATIADMTTPSATNPGYAKGWAVNTANNWWHTGALDGTATFFARTSGGFTWAILLNKRQIGALANPFWNALDALPWNCLAATSSYPSHDLMALPTVSASALTFAPLSDTSLAVSWQNGDGDQRIVVARAAGPVSAFPLDGTIHTANATFGAGQDLGSGNYVVYSGSSNSVTVSGLSPGVVYHFRVFEFNQNAVTGMHPLYLLCNSVSGSASSCAVSTVTTGSLRAVDATPPGRVSLGWTASGGGGFNLHRTEDETQLPLLWSDMLSAVGSSLTNFIEDSPPVAPLHYYQLYAAGCTGESLP